MQTNRKDIFIISTNLRSTIVSPPPANAYHNEEPIYVKSNLSILGNCLVGNNIRKMSAYRRCANSNVDRVFHYIFTRSGKYVRHRFFIDLFVT